MANYFVNNVYLFVLLIIFFVKVIICENESTLKQIHVFFRHGQKTPEKVGLYPKDPYLNYTFPPYGYGSLTKLGQYQAYNIGKNLRKRYNNFLPELYSSDFVYARCTNYDRTKMSLQLVLSGIWTPMEKQMWSSLLSSEARSYEFQPMEKDKLFKFPLFYCPKYQEEYKKAKESEEMKIFLESNKEKINFINNHSGLNITSTFDLYVLYMLLSAEKDLELQLPQWTMQIYPEFLEQSTLMEYKMETYNDEMIKTAAGHFIKKIIDDAKSVVEGNPIQERKKLFLYGGHEFNMVYILAALKLFNNHIPPLASYIIFELHEINLQYGFKIFYQDYFQNELQMLKIPKCHEFCTLETFEELICNIIPDKNSC